MDHPEVGDSSPNGRHRLRVVVEDQRPSSVREAVAQPPVVAPRTNLPAPLTRFIGREAELAGAAALLADARLLTVTGPGGCGKTRLALRLADVHADHFPDGVCLVGLASLSGGEFVTAEVAMTLGVDEPERGSTLVEALCRRLASWRGLIVLDNCEHVAAAAAELAARLLAAAPDLKIIATSREPLGVGGEMTWAAPTMSEADAVELFIDRARAALPEFTFGPEDAAAVRAICHQLDGLPLAIELAAARTRALAPADIAAHLNDRFRLLSAGRTAPPRQATLRASFDWSHELLSNAEQALLRQLAVFSGGFELDAAMAVCPVAAVDVLAELVDRSLVTVEHTVGRAVRRYRMLETIRQFADDRLTQAGDERDVVGSRHCDYFLALAERAEPDLEGANQDVWLPRLAAEQDNLRAALAWARDHHRPESLARLAAALALFWMGRSQFTECRSWLEAAADGVTDNAPLVRARVRNRQCLLEIWAGSLGAVPALANEAIALARQTGSGSEEMIGLSGLGMAAGMAVGAEAMRPYLEQALPMARETGPGWVLANDLWTFGLLRWLQSDPEQTRRVLGEAVAVATAGGHRRMLRLAMVVSGVFDVSQGRLADAIDQLEAALAAGREANHAFVMIFGLIGLAWVRLLRGDQAGARAAASEGLEVARQSEESKVFEGLAIWLSGWTTLASGDAAHARRTLAEAVNVIRIPEMPRFAALPLVTLAEAELRAGVLDRARDCLDDALALGRAAAFTWVLGRGGLVRARLGAAEGEAHDAETAVHDAISLQRDAGDVLGLVDSLESLAGLAAGQQSFREAVRLWAAVESQRIELGYVRYPADREAHEAAIARAKVAVGADDFDAAWAEGAQLSLDSAIAYAARGRGERGRPTSGWSSLTPSELEVVRLIGQHLTNPEIAARLLVSRATVKTHLVHVFTKLGISSRSQLAAEAIKRGIDRVPRDTPLWADRASPTPAPTIARPDISSG
jgi:predicted ATPase/DNA-binding CsgD family transcriptional regulator